MADIHNPLLETLVERLYTSNWPKNGGKQRSLWLEVYKAHGYHSPIPEHIRAVKSNFVQCLKSDTPPAWITEDAELLLKFKAIVEKIPHQKKLRKQLKRALSMPEFKSKKSKIEAIHIKDEPDFDYTAEKDVWVAVPCHLDPESEDEIIDVGEIQNEYCQGVDITPDDVEICPDLPTEEPRITALFRIVDGYRCYYGDDELVGCAYVSQGCIRAQGYEFWSDAAKRNHTRRDELERQVQQIKLKAQMMEEDRVQAVMYGRRNAAKPVLTKRPRNTKDMIAGKQLKLGPSLIHGQGLYALEPIFEGEGIIEYVGDRITMEEADERERKYMETGTTSTYFFQVGTTNQVLDATKIGNNSRYINHSCDPNCSSQIIANCRIMIVCERDIEPGEELTYDYRLSCEEKTKKIHCLCGAKNCRSYMNYDKAQWQQMETQKTVKEEVVSLEELESV